MYGLKQVVKTAARAARYEIHCTKELPERVAGIRHGQVFPSATYCPWLADEDFNVVYQTIKNSTLVDLYRCYELWQLVTEVAKLRAGDLMEVGVWRGGTGALIAKKCQLAGIKADIYLCDTFKGVVKAGILDKDYRGGEHADATKRAVLDMCSTLKLDRVHILEGIFPDESSSSVDKRWFRFCHIDVDVYQSAKHVLDWIWPRLVPGGMVVYDDYGFYSCVGITRFVNEQRPKRDRLVIHNLNGHAIVIKLADTFISIPMGEQEHQIADLA